MEIKKKVWPEFFDKILSGEKKFELKLADFEINKGDVLVLEEWNPETKQYTGRKVEKKVNYIIKTKDQKFWPQEEVDKFGFLVLGFE